VLKVIRGLLGKRGKLGKSVQKAQQVLQAQKVLDLRTGLAREILSSGMALIGLT
jgi:hypothetical protein